MLDHGVSEYIFYMHLQVYSKRGPLVDNWPCMVGGALSGDNKQTTGCPNKLGMFWKELLTTQNKIKHLTSIGIFRE